MFSREFLKFLLFLTFSLLFIFLLFKYLPERFPEFSWSNDNITSTIASLVVLISMLYGLLQSNNLKILLSQLSMWLGIFVIIITAYAFRFELEYGYQRVIAVIIPSSTWIDKEGQLVISRNSDGHFYIVAIVNNIPIRFMIDTGASDVALTQKDAIKLKFDLSKLTYSRTYFTANGSVTAAPITLAKFKIGPKYLENVKGHISKGELDVSLLGMSVIGQFKSFKIDKDLLMLSY